MKFTVNRLLEVHGTPFQLGYKQGETFTSHKAEFVTTMREFPKVPPWSRPFLFSSLIKKWLRIRGGRVMKEIGPVLERHFNGYWNARLSGLAQGLGISLKEIYGYNSVEFITASIAYAGGCTAIAFDASLTKEAEPILAYNHDYISIFSPFLFLRRNCPEGFYSSLVMTYQPAAGAICGINEKGLAVSLNHAYSTDEIAPGIPLAMMVQSTLDRCASTQEAVSFVERLPVPCGGMMTFLDNYGDRVAIELAPSRRAVREVEGEPLYSFNQYQMKEMFEVEIPQNAIFPRWCYPSVLRGQAFHRFNWIRRERYLEIKSGLKSWSQKEIKKLLGDHGKEKMPSRHTICRHHADTANTVASVLIYPAKRSLEICLGNPCSLEFQMISL